MTRTKPLMLVMLALLGVAAGWFIETALTASGRPIIIPPFTLAIALLLIGVIIVLMALPVRRVSRGVPNARIDPFYATRVVVLAKASSLSGALLGGGGLGIAFYLLSRSVVPGVGSITMAFATAVGALLLLVGGLVAEHMCTIPPDDDDTDVRPGPPRNPVSERLELPVNEWRRVSAKYIIVDVVGWLIFSVVAVIATSLPAFLSGNVWLYSISGSLAIILLITIVLTPRRVRSIGYQLREDDLLFRRGLMFQRFVSVPYGRMQLVDINRGPLARAVGLSELKFVTAAAATGVTIPGLPAADAEELRDRLVELAESRRAGL